MGLTMMGDDHLERISSWLIRLIKKAINNLTIRTSKYPIYYMQYGSILDYFHLMKCS